MKKVFLEGSIGMEGNDMFTLQGLATQVASEYMHLLLPDLNCVWSIVKGVACGCFDTHDSAVPTLP